MRLGIAAAVLLGAALRMARINEQLLTGDELHALVVALSWPVSQIFSTWTYEGADYGVPMAALLRVAMNAGLTPDELTLRAIPLLCGTLSIGLMPWLLRSRLGERATVVFAFLLAVSPLLAIYSRLARSYAPAVLMAFIAVVAFDRWWSRGSRPAGVVYAVSAAFALWWNLSTAPFVAAPVTYALLRLCLGDRDLWRRRQELFTVATLALTSALLPLIPARESLSVLNEVHGAGVLPGWGTWLEVVRMHSGSRIGVVSAIVLLGVIRGGVLAWQQDRRWLSYLAAIAALHALGLAILGPDQLDNPIVINRYLLVLLPFGLSLCAAGWTVPLPRVSTTAQTASIIAVLITLLVTGPFASRTFAQTSFSTASTFAYFIRDGNTIAYEDMPAFYQTLSEVEERQPIIEYPWSNLATHAFDAYQKHHGQPLYVVTPWKSLHDERIALRKMMAPSLQGYLSSPARWIVVHQDLQREERRIATSDPNHWMRLDERPMIWEPLQIGAPVTLRLLQRSFGPADYRDDQIQAWDLDRLRQAQ